MDVAHAVDGRPPGVDGRRPESLDDVDGGIRSVFDRVRSRVLPDAPETVRRNCHLQGNEFNVTHKPDFETGSDRAREVIDEALVHELDLFGEAVAAELGLEEEGPGRWTRRYYAERDPEIRGVLEAVGGLPAEEGEEVPDEVREVLERVDVAYYEADAAEMGSLELDKVVGVRAAFDVLGVEDPFAVMMGDSKSDLRVMEWLEETRTGIAAAPEHASRDVLGHVRSTDELVFDRGNAVEMLRTIYALNRLAALEG